MKHTDQLWGGILDEVALDVNAQTLTLFVTVTHGQSSVRHELRMFGVNELHFVNAIPSQWDYAEVTELRFERDTVSGPWRFEIVLWSEDASITGLCSSATMDGAEQT